MYHLATVVPVCHTVYLPIQEDSDTVDSSLDPRSHLVDTPTPVDRDIHLSDSDEKSI